MAPQYPNTCCCPLPPFAVCHGPGDAAAVADYQRPKKRDAPYTPTTLVGARLPHAPLRVRQAGRLLAEVGSQSVASTVDLPAAAGTGLVLLLSGSSQQGSWEAAAAAAEAATGVPVFPVVAAQSAAAISGGGSSAGEGTTVVQDTEGAWLRLRGIPQEGALLVRPDGHIAWRHGGQGDLAGELQQAVRTVMAKP